jgi:hypothetical protein
MRAKHCLPMVAVVLLAACDGATPTEPVHPVADITPQAELYAPGSTVTLTLRNLTAQTIAFSPCYWTLQKRVLGGEWVRVGSASIAIGAADLCIASPQIAPGAAGIQDVVLPGSLHEGRYRVLFLVNGGASEPGPWPQPSHTFKVAGSPAIPVRME